MKDFSILRLLDKFAGLFKKLGVDYQTMRKILQVKLIMDERRVPTILSNKNTFEGKNSFKSSLLMYGVIGLFIGMLMLPPFPLFYKMNIVFGMIIFMVMATMISDFSAVLLDVRDKNILLPRPIDSRTISTAKIIHIVIYLFSITMTISGFALIVGLIMYGIMFALIFLIELILICCFVVFFTSILYLAILSFFDGEKLKDIINYFQILLSVFMLVSYQFIGRIFDLSRITITFQPASWHFFLPTTWFAAPFSLFIEHSFTKYFTVLSLLGVVIPALTTLLYIILVIPYFEGKLQKLNSDSAGISQGTGIKEKLHRALAHLICFNKTESAFYRFTQNMLANERKLKLKLYPNLAFAIVMPFIMLSSALRYEKSFAEVINKVSNGPYYLALYMTAAFLAMTTTMLSTSEKFRGAWIYRALPIESPISILKGALKAFIIKFMLPVYCFTGLMFVLLCGLKIMPDIILIFLNMLILALITFKLNRKELPFYKDFQYTPDGSRVGILFLSLLICGAFAVIHFLIKYLTFGVEINIIGSLILIAVLWNLSFKITWKDVMKDSI